MRFYIVLDQELEEIANNIRSIYNISNSLAFPNDFINSLSILSNSDVDPNFLKILDGTISKLTDNTVSSIREYAFPYCTDLTQVEFTNCSIIGSFAFITTNLIQASFPKCEVIHRQAFQYLSLTEINIPMCQSISYSVFANCQSLTTISLPACNFIGNNAFISCYRLSSLFLMSNSVVELESHFTPWYHFQSTPIGGYTAYNKNKYGSVYVPESLVTAYQNDPVWASISARIVGI